MIRHFVTPSSMRLVSILCLATALFSPASLLGQCGDNEPAFPVPKCRVQNGGAEDPNCTNPNSVQLWPSGFEPTRPGLQLPALRDSTQWRSFTIPGASTGHELFYSLDIVGNNLYTVYNAGLQVWSIAGNNAQDPDRLFFADGWTGGFLEFPSAGENDFFVFDVDAINPSVGSTGNLIGVAGEDGVGPSFWEHTASSLDQHYQDLGSRSRQIRLVEFGGVVYAFVAEGQTGGILVYNVSAAANLPFPCLDSQGAVCPGIYLGKVGNATNVAFLDVLLANGRIFIAAGRDGGLPAEIWEVSNPSNPGSAVRKFSGLTGGAQGVALFQKNGSTYLGVVERLPGLIWEARIYNASTCITSGSCSVGSPRWTYRPAQVGQARYVTYSVGNGTPYLYYGVQSNNLSGSAIEGLFDLTDLTPTGPLPDIPEITEEGGSYTDQCTGKTVDYWGDYYPGNGHGLRNVRPRVGKFNGEYFYRAAFGILDVHQLTDPTPSLSISGPTEVCPGEANSYDAIANSCSPQPPGAPYNWTAPGGTIGNQGQDTVNITWTAPGTSNVTVTNNNCPGAQGSLLVSIQDASDLDFTGPLTVDPSIPGLGEVATFQVSTSAGTAEWQWTFEWMVGGVPQSEVRLPVFNRTAGETQTFQIPANADTGTNVGSATVTIMNCTGDLQDERTIDFDIVLNPLEVNEFKAQGCVLGFCDFFVNQTVVFDQDFAGNPAQARYDWDGDGDFDQVVNNPGALVTHVYTQPMSSFFPRVEISNAGVSPVVFTHLDPLNIIDSAPPPPNPPTITVLGPGTRAVNQPGVYDAVANNCNPAANGWNWTASGGQISGNTGSDEVTITWSTNGTKTVRATNSACGAAQGTRIVSVTGGNTDELNASFTFSPGSPVAGAPVSFNAGSSTGNIALFSWDFGDATSGTGENVSHTYDAPGSYSVTLTIEEPNCSNPQCLDTATAMVAVGDGEPPTPLPNDEALVVPYFVVDTFAPPGQGLTTLFSVRNSSDSEVMVMYEYFASEDAEPFTTEELPLAPNGVRSVDLRVVSGLPNDPSTGIARGYVLITGHDIVSEGRALGGGYFLLDRFNDFSSGSPLLTTAAPDLCSTWQVQFFNGGDFDGTELTIYAPGNAGSEDPVVTGSIYDEAGTLQAELQLTSPATAFNVNTLDLDLGIDFGALELAFGDGVKGHISVLYRNSGRFSVGSPAVCMD